MKASEILATAKNAIISRGWCQGKYEDEQRHVCSYGALDSVPYDNDCEAYDAAVAYLQNAVGDKGIVCFNDAPERTKDEVLGKFDEAILSAVAAGE